MKWKVYTIVCFIAVLPSLAIPKSTVDYQQHHRNKSNPFSVDEPAADNRTALPATIKGILPDLAVVTKPKNLTRPSNTTKQTDDQTWLANTPKPVPPKPVTPKPIAPKPIPPTRPYDATKPDYLVRPSPAPKPSNWTWLANVTQPKTEKRPPTNTFRYNTTLHNNNASTWRNPNGIPWYVPAPSPPKIKGPVQAKVTPVPLLNDTRSNSTLRPDKNPTQRVGKPLYVSLEDYIAIQKNGTLPWLKNEGVKVVVVPSNTTLLNNTALPKQDYTRPSNTSRNIDQSDKWNKPDSEYQSIWRKPGSIVNGIVNRLRPHEHHDVELVNNCESGTAVFTYGQSDQKHDSGTYSGPVTAGMAWLEGFEGDRCSETDVSCGVVLFKLVNPSDGANGYARNLANYWVVDEPRSSAENLLYPMKFRFTGSCTKKAPGRCYGDTPDHCPGAFFGQRPLEGPGHPVQCSARNTGIHISFC